jgi:UDP-3-O-[3-hydroxymyristoyl] glucosamine N-acyltransferase
VNAGAKVGKNVILNTATNIEHDAVIGDHCHISTGTMINGECKVGERCFIGSQSVLANCISVGDDIINNLKKTFGDDKIKIQPGKVKFDSLRRNNRNYNRTY